MPGHRDGLAIQPNDYPPQLFTETTTPFGIGRSFCQYLGSIAPSLFTWNLLILDFLYLPVCPFVCLVDARYWRISASGTRISIINAATPAAKGAAERGRRVCRVRKGEVRKIDPPFNGGQDHRCRRRPYRSSSVQGFVIVGE